ncbi:hypothetical protein BS78_03G210500 [Paspalum vaginatum]|nr:hypothetical protein BS78_03G210500 [Paspalum vaginatum]
MESPTAPLLLPCTWTKGVRVGSLARSLCVCSQGEWTKNLQVRVYAPSQIIPVGHRQLHIDTMYLQHKYFFSKFRLLSCERELQKDILQVQNMLPLPISDKPYWYDGFRNSCLLIITFNVAYIAMVICFFRIYPLRVKLRKSIHSLHSCRPALQK